MSPSEVDLPAWAQPLPPNADEAQQVEEARASLLLDPQDAAQVNRKILDPMHRLGIRFWLAIVVLGGGVAMLFATWVYQMWWGLGITGLMRPAMWAVYIVNFVYFIGIGHAGTFISAALRVLKYEFRRPISRAAEMVTVFGLATAALFPLIHLGRTWKFYWLLPYPNQRQLWPSFHSPLMWDLTAILTYLSCSALFLLIGLIPDLAMVRDHTTGWKHRVYEMLAFGWRGTEREWATQDTAMKIFSYCIIPVMFSVHTIVAWDFAMAIQPGWHSTILGPYFVAGALFSGVGAVIIALVIVRKALHLEYFLRAEHLAGMGRFLLLLSLVWTYFYFNDYIVPWYGQDPAEKVLQQLMQIGKAAPLWYLMLFANIVVPCATLWSKKVCRSSAALVVVAIFVQIGMYIERVLIVPVTLSHNELPFSWGAYRLMVPETLITIGAFAMVAFLYVLFTRLIPVIPVWEVREGQALTQLRRIGRALVPSRAEPED